MVVLEVAVSESKAKLERDVEFWLDPARGNANIALTLEAARKKPVIDKTFRFRFSVDHSV